jgi:phosphate/sulfate permease
MADYFLFIVILLGLLAISDLVVGVSNDAVNFLNSAIGSKVAPFKVIMIVAGLGIVIGATFSSGMMEVARKGILNPEAFYFSEIMIIFLAVMLTDIFLLDLFNTFGLPTSTTVSLIFELLGAAVVVAVIKLYQQGQDLGNLVHYINSSSALAIISTILSSVVVAFICGMIVQYLSRLLFTYHFEKRLAKVGAIWAGLALTLLTYFLIFKGLKGTSFIDKSTIAWIGEHTNILLLGAFVVWTILMQLLHSAFKINMLRIVVLFGTFSLAMAFAGNDLVNFIGVPMAGLESFRIWSSSGADAGQLTMGLLHNPVKADTMILLIAGVIMVVTLWLSRKARSVTDTEVSLGRQGEGYEKFSSNAVARGIVRYTRLAGKAMTSAIPQPWLKSLETRFQKLDINKENGHAHEAPAFDLVRAAVNLTVASSLIAFATSLKLPLSTTYVTFMVAMGSSLADGAWGRDSAVFRVAGVVNVIAGWFVTAVIAFSVAGLCAATMFLFGAYGVITLVVLLILVIIKTFTFHRKKEQKRAQVAHFEQYTDSVSVIQMMEETSQNAGKTINLIAQTYQNAIEGLIKEDRALINRARQNLSKLKKDNENLEFKIYHAIKRLKDKAESGRLYLLVYDLEQDALQSVDLIVEACSEHVDNSLPPLAPQQVDNLRKVAAALDNYLNQIAVCLQHLQFEELDRLAGEKYALFEMLENQLAAQLEGIKNNGYGLRNSMLMFSLKLETKDIISIASRLAALYSRAPEEEKVIMLAVD